MKSSQMKLIEKLAAGVAFVFFIQAVVLVHASETNFWHQRKEQFAALPKTMPAPLPSVNSKPVFDPNRNELPKAYPELPMWIQQSLAPYSTIQALNTSNNNQNAKTVIVMQDAHLHHEAQANIAGSIDALSQELKKRSSYLLVGMEGLDSAEADFSVYNQIPERKILKDVAHAMMRANILNGIELAAIGYQGDGQDGPVTLPFRVVGVEYQSEYEANVQALREAVLIREKVQKELDVFKQAITSLKNIHFSNELQQLDARQTAYHDGSLGIPEYVMYLDSISPAKDHNLKLLIEAALIEGNINFEQVDSERTKILSLLVKKMSKNEIQTLLQYSNAYKTGHVSYGEFYGYMKKLCAKNNLDLKKFPEMNLYIQYVLKSDSIKTDKLFEGVWNLERQVQDKLAQTADQKEILELSLDYHLLTKLANHTLTEDEWHLYESRRTRVHNMQARFKDYGYDFPIYIEDLGAHGIVLEMFYNSAIARNKTMVDKISEALTHAPTDMGLLVVGGFHTQGVVNGLEEKGFQVITTSPKITQMGDTLSSLDILASGRLPIDQLFVGERLFLPVSSQPLGPQGNFVAGLAKSVTEVLRTPGQRDVATHNNVTTTENPSENNSDGVILKFDNGTTTVSTHKKYISELAWTDAIIGLLMSTVIAMHVPQLSSTISKLFILAGVTITILMLLTIKFVLDKKWRTMGSPEERRMRELLENGITVKPLKGEPQEGDVVIGGYLVVPRKTPSFIRQSEDEMKPNKKRFFNLLLPISALGLVLGVNSTSSAANILLGTMGPLVNVATEQAKQGSSTLNVLLTIAALGYLYRNVIRLLIRELFGSKYYRSPAQNKNLRTLKNFAVAALTMAASISLIFYWPPMIRHILTLIFPAVVLGTIGSQLKISEQPSPLPIDDEDALENFDAEKVFEEMSRLIAIKDPVVQNSKYISNAHGDILELTSEQDPYEVMLQDKFLEQIGEPIDFREGLREEFIAHLRNFAIGNISFVEKFLSEHGTEFPLLANIFDELISEHTESELHDPHYAVPMFVFLILVGTFGMMGFNNPFLAMGALGLIWVGGDLFPSPKPKIFSLGHKRQELIGVGVQQNDFVGLKDNLTSDAGTELNKLNVNFFLEAFDSADITNYYDGFFDMAREARKVGENIYENEILKGILLKIAQDAELTLQKVDPVSENTFYMVDAVYAEGITNIGRGLLLLKEQNNGQWPFQFATENETETNLVKFAFALEIQLEKERGKRDSADFYNHSVPRILANYVVHAIPLGWMIPGLAPIIAVAIRIQTRDGFFQPDFNAVLEKAQLKPMRYDQKLSRWLKISKKVQELYPDLKYKFNITFVEQKGQPIRERNRKAIFAHIVIDRTWPDTLQIVIDKDTLALEVAKTQQAHKDRGFYLTESETEDLVLMTAIHHEILELGYDIPHDTLGKAGLASIDELQSKSSLAAAVLEDEITLRANRVAGKDTPTAQLVEQSVDTAFRAVPILRSNLPRQNKAELKYIRVLGSIEFSQSPTHNVSATPKTVTQIHDMAKRPETTPESIQFNRFVSDLQNENVQWAGSAQQASLRTGFNIQNQTVEIVNVDSFPEMGIDIVAQNFDNSDQVPAVPMTREKFVKLLSEKITESQETDIEKFHLYRRLKLAIARGHGAFLNHDHFDPNNPAADIQYLLSQMGIGAQSKTHNILLISNTAIAWGDLGEMYKNLIFNLVHVFEYEVETVLNGGGISGRVTHYLYAMTQA